MNSIVRFLNVCTLTFVLSISFIFSAHASAVSPTELEDWYDRFGNRHKSATFPDSSNAAPGVYQRPSLWGQSGSMRALVEVHKGNQDSVSILKLAEAAEHVLAYTSEKLGFIDVLQNKTLPAWGTGYYSCNQYRVSAVHTGVLSYPIAYFSRVVLSNPLKYQSEMYTRLDGSVVNYYDLAKEFLTEANRAVESHSHQFDAQEGAYRFPSNYSSIGSCSEVLISGTTKKLHGAQDFTLKNNQIQPYNMTMALGMAHIELSNAFTLLGTSLGNTEAAKHLDIASKIAAAFKRDTHLGDASQTFDWRYLKFNVDGSQGRIEDVTHAGLVVGFITRMFEESLVFNQADIQVLIDAFNTVAQNPAKVHTHVNYTYGSSTPTASAQRKAQRGIVSWTPLSLVDPSLYDKIRQIFHQYEGGYDANNWYGEAVLLRFAPKDRQYPILARSPSDHKSYIPNYALRFSNGSGLYRNSAIPVTTIDGKSASSCAEYVFSKPQTRPLEIEYRQVQSIGNLDSCSGSACGTSPGFHVFTANLTRIEEEDVASFLAATPLQESDWSYADSLPMDPAGVAQTGSVAPNQPYNRVLVCRSGAGNARDNISVRYVGIPLTVPSNLVYDDDFRYSTDGWMGNSVCTDFTNTHQSGDSGHSLGYLNISETHTYASSDSYSACRPLSTGKLDFSYQKDQVLNYGQGFKISGWTRFQSNYNGGSRVNNRCVKVLDASQIPEVVLASKCVNWTNTNDTGWRYFDYDFTAQVGTVPEVRVVIGGTDSWKANWNQTMSIDDIKITVKQ